MMGAVIMPFEVHRPRLFSIAYRMLGSKAEAEDIVQEAFLRWQAAPRAEVASERAFLSTIVTRLCLDQIKSARSQRESYIGPWLPEPMRTDEPPDTVDHESISLAFLVLLESLTPVERAVYLLHEVFDYSHAEVAAIVDKDEAACRQLLHRAKAHISARRPRFAASRDDHQRLLTQFLTAVTAGDLDGMRTMLAADATAWSDGGGKAAAARKPIQGPDDISRFFAGLAKKMAPGMVPEVAEVNGWPALILRTSDGTAVNVLTIETDGERIYNIHSVANPDKLRGI